MDSTITPNEKCRSEQPVRPQQMEPLKKVQINFYKRVLWSILI